jgi:hypothetical protein
MPIIGLTWRPDASLTIEAALPESRCDYMINDAFSVHLGAAWRSTTFAVKDSSDMGRDELTIEDIHAFGGVDAKVSEQVSFTADIGMIFDRYVKSDISLPGLDDSVEADAVPFIRLGMKGRF